MVFNFDEILNESMTGGENFGADIEATNNGYTPDMAGVMQIVMESMQEDFELEKAVDSTAYKARIALAEGATVDMEMLQEGVVGNVFTKIKETVQKMWAKMKEFFGKVVMYFESLFAKEDKFMKKYEKELRNASAWIDSEFEIEGFKYTVEGKLDIASIYTAMEKKIRSGRITSMKDLEASIEAFKENDYKDSLCALAVTGSTASDFTKELYKVLRDGEDSKKTLTSINLDEHIKYAKDKSSALSQVTKDKQGVDKSYNAAIKQINESIKANEEASKSAEGDALKLRQKRSVYYTAMCNKLRDGLGLINLVAGAKQQAIKDRASQAVKICYKAISYGGKKKKESEK